jgi:hypothetical protein
LAHLLHPIHGERVSVKIENLTDSELEKEVKEPLRNEIQKLSEKNDSILKLQRKQEKLKKLENKELTVVRLYDDANQKESFVEITELGSIKDKKIIHGIIVAKKNQSDSQIGRFFKLEERYDREKELYEDTYHIL